MKFYILFYNFNERMGATTSIEYLPKRHIHICVAEHMSTKYLYHTLLFKKLEEYNVLVTITDPNEPFSKQKKIIDNCEIVLVCLNSNITGHYAFSQQLDYSEKKIKRILFLVMEDEYSPQHNIAMKQLVGSNDWEKFTTPDYLDVILCYLNENFASIIQSQAAEM